MTPSSTPVGQVRPSQLLWTYGPGSLIDLPNLSVLTMGIDRWDLRRCPRILEPRLLDAVKRVIGAQIRGLHAPPAMAGENPDPFSPEAKVGVPVRPFPRWLRCVKCGLLAEFGSGLFDLDPDPFRPDRTHFVHVNCERMARGSKGDAVPARFMMACTGGHLDDFPWHWYVHEGPSTCKGILRFFEAGASLQTENLWVKCEGCTLARSMAQAFGRQAERSLPTCRGRHPHLDSFERECKAESRAVLLGATNGWFAVTMSTLAIPIKDNQLGQLVEEGWEYLEEIDSAAMAEVILKTLIKTSALPGIEAFKPAEVFKEIEAVRRDKASGGGVETPIDLKGPEWRVLTQADPPRDWPHFMGKKAEAPSGYGGVVDRVLLLERLREVNALLGFTRVEAPERGLGFEKDARMAPLSAAAPTWLPATEVHGEGVFLTLAEAKVAEWEKRAAVQARSRKLQEAYKAWRAARKLPSDVGFPGIRYVMLHTLSHLLLREMALSCGYNAASIRERVYSRGENGQAVAGILLYTAAADSDGTLGGLVDLGKPENLGPLLAQCLRRASICSSDPLCSEHDPEKDRSLHASACHACGFAAETSCEYANRFLDRSLIVPTFAAKDSAFFSPEGVPVA